MNREQIIKMLETIDEVGDCSRDCIFYNGKVHSCGGTIAKHALALIKELIDSEDYWKRQTFDACVDKGRMHDKIKELTKESQKWQEAYDCVDAACRELSSKCDELTEEIKDLEADYECAYEQAEADIHGNIADGGTSCHWCIDKTKRDTVNRMQERLQEEFAKIMIVRGVDNDDPNMDSDDVWDALALVVKELLEEKNNV